MALDLALVAVLALAAIRGALSGALRQLVSLAAVVLGWAAARRLGADVAQGLSGTVGGALARVVGPALLFLGAAAAASLAGALILRATGVARAVRSPADRAAGALLGGAKGGLGIWVILSAVALASEALPDRVARHVRESDLYALARAHNLLARLDPGAARRFERALEAAQAARRAGALARDPAAARLLSEPALRELGAAGGRLDPAEVARLLEDPEIRAAVERLAGRAGDAAR